MMIAKSLGVDRTPAQIVLLQELERWNKLVVVMARSLADLQKALVGEIGMSDSLDALGNDIFNGFLPGMFRRLAPDTQMKVRLVNVAFVIVSDRTHSRAFSSFLSSLFLLVPTARPLDGPLYATDGPVRGLDRQR